MKTQPTRKVMGDISNQLPPEILPNPFRVWPEEGFEATPCLRSGAVLGAIAACVSLLANVVGSVAWPAISGQPQHPLRLIQVFLTFPLGENALTLNSGWVLASGCLLYLTTGVLYGMLFEFAACYFLPHARLGGRLIFFTLLAVLVWIVGFYGILLWLQPLLFGGRWIVDLIPWWVAGLSHVLFGITMAAIYPLRRSKKVGD